MAHSRTELGDQTLPRDARSGENVVGKVWGKINLVVTRTIFWSFERGSWKYDLLVLAILLFIFLSPHAWFDDRPTLQMTYLRHQQGIVELGHGKEGWRYQIDARLVESFAPLKPEEAIPVILKRRLNRPFTVKAIAPFVDKNNVVLGYTVSVER